jgi:DNA-binding response OmpR family regulator
MMAAPTVLVVDDDASARQTVEAMLLPEAYRLQFASNGTEALLMLGSVAADLVLCDVSMPEMDGFEVCRAIKTHVEWRLVPVILLTALDDVADQVTGLAAGADEFLSKPLVGAVLRARTRAMLRVRSQYTELKREQPNPEALLQARRDHLVEKASLTGREAEVLRLLLLGRGHDEISRLLGISERTSKFHQGNVLRKLGAESRYDLLRLFT